MIEGTIQIITVVRALVLLFSFYQLISFGVMIESLKTYAIDTPSRFIHSLINCILWLAIFFADLFIPW